MPPITEITDIQAKVILLMSGWISKKRMSMPKE